VPQGVHRYPCTRCHRQKTASDRPASQRYPPAIALPQRYCVITTCATREAGGHSCERREPPFQLCAAPLAKPAATDQSAPSRTQARAPATPDSWSRRRRIADTRMRDRQPLPLSTGAISDVNAAASRRGPAAAGRWLLSDNVFAVHDAPKLTAR